MKRILIILSFIACLFSSCWEQGKIPSLQESFLRNDSLPFGTSFAYGMLQDAYNDKYLQLQKQGIEEINDNLYHDTASLYYCITNRFLINDNEVSSLLQFVRRGNTAFIAARDIDSLLMQSLGSEQYNALAFTQVAPYAFQKTRVHLVNEYVQSGDTSFGYYFSPFTNYIKGLNTVVNRVVGTNSARQPNLVVFFLGKGRLYLQCDPRALSNYFLMSSSNHLYLQNILALLPRSPTDVYVDDYYCHRNYKKGDSQSLLSFIFSKPALAWAFMLFIIVFLLYVLLNGKRRQRIIAEKKPLINASVAFIEAISGLYYKKKDNKNVAEKMIVYFYDDLRTRFYISTTSVNNDFIDIVSRKSGLDEENTSKLFYNIKMVQDQDTVSDELLMHLNKSIENYKQAIKQA